MCGFFIFDAFGTFTGIRYSGHHRIRSSIGGVMTILSAIAVIVTIAYFGNVYLSGSEASQVYTQVKYWSGQNFTLPENFVFAAANQYQLKINNRNDIFEMQVEYLHFNTTSFTNIYIEPLSNDSCNIKDWSLTEKQFQQYGLDAAYCYKVSNYNLEGSVNNDILRYIRIKYVLKLGDDEWNAYLQKELEDNYPTANLYFIENFYNLDGKSLVPDYFINTVQINLTYDTLKTTNVYLSNDEYSVQKDYIFATKDESSFTISLQSSVERTSFRYGSQTTTLTLNIMPATIKTLVSYSFMTFSDMLSRIGGIVQNLITVFFLFNYVKNYWGYEINQFNELFNKIEIDLAMKTNLLPVQKKFTQLLNSSGISKFKNKSNLSVNPLIPDTPYRDIALKINKEYKSDSDLSKNNNQNSNNFFNVSNNESNNLYSMNNRNVDDGLSILKRGESNLAFNNGDRSNINNIHNNDHIISEIRDNDENRMILDMNKLNNKDMELKEVKDTNIINHSNTTNKQPIGSTLFNTVQNNSNNEKDLQKRKMHLLKALSSIAQPLKIRKNTDKEEFYNEIILHKRKQPNEKFQLTFWEYFNNKYFACSLKKSDSCNICCSNSRGKYKTFQYIDDYLNSSLEMKNYEKTYFQMNLMKFLFLNDEQLRAFEQVPLVTGYSIIQKQVEFAKSLSLDYNFGYDNASIEGLQETDKRLHSLFIGMNH